MYSVHTFVTPITVFVNWLIFFSVYTVIAYISKSYVYVIRLSVIEDLYRVFMSVMVATIILVFLNVMKLLITGEPFMKFWNILIIAAFSFSLMMIERLCIKYLYMRMNSATEGRKRVMVLGTTFNSLFLANALKGEIGGKYLPVGLLSIKSNQDVTEMNGFKVYRFDPSTITEVFKEKNIEGLIYDSKSNNLMRSGFADFFIKNDIALLAMNRVEEFDQDNARP